ncbi:MAG: mechanosensitive ion channel protein MscL [Firmicutes bacterium]|nr:mechanosensitive ion channel protein MscL [Bacillota bacterium]HWR28196.1 large conductance mechanosensitive channel protein MscL [Negativicutes bacterium]
MLKEFKEFIMRGNVLDLAVGIIIGGAFGKIVSSFVADILMPPLGLIMGKVSFPDLFINLSGTHYPSVAAAKAAGALTINYGIFINTVIDFLIVSTAIYFLVAQVNFLNKKPAEVPPATKECPFCISAIPIKAVRCPHCTSNLE